jgi:hypothetical protein
VQMVLMGSWMLPRDYWSSPELELAIVVRILTIVLCYFTFFGVTFSLDFGW